MILVFFVSARFLRRFPPLIVAMLAGIAYMLYSGVDFSGVEFSVNFPEFIVPEFIVPEFTLKAFLSYGLPLALILVGMETPAGVGLVKAWATGTCQPTPSLQWAASPP